MSLFIGLHVAVYLCCFQFGIISGAAANIHIQVVVGLTTLIFLDKYLGVDGLIIMASVYVLLLRKCQKKLYHFTFSPAACENAHSSLSSPALDIGHSF